MPRKAFAPCSRSGPRNGRTADARGTARSTFPWNGEVDCAAASRSPPSPVHGGDSCWFGVEHVRSRTAKRGEACSSCRHRMGHPNGGSLRCVGCVALRGAVPDGRGLHARDHHDCWNFHDRRIRRVFRRDGAGLHRLAESQAERHIMARTLFLALTLIGAASSTALAQFRGTQTEQAACRRDAVHFCRGISDDAQVERCLISHRHRVSERCRRVLQAHGR